MGIKSIKENYGAFIPFISAQRNNILSAFLPLESYEFIQSASHTHYITLCVYGRSRQCSASASSCLTYSNRVEFNVTARAAQYAIRFIKYMTEERAIVSRAPFLYEWKIQCGARGLNVPNAAGQSRSRSSSFRAHTFSLESGRESPRSEWRR